MTGIPGPLGIDRNPRAFGDYFDRNPRAYEDYFDRNPRAFGGLTGIPEPLTGIPGPLTRIPGPLTGIPGPQPLRMFAVVVVVNLL